MKRKSSGHARGCPRIRVRETDAVKHFEYCADCGRFVRREPVRQLRLEEAS